MYHMEAYFFCTPSESVEDQSSQTVVVSEGELQETVSARFESSGSVLLNRVGHFSRRLSQFILDEQESLCPLLKRSFGNVFLVGSLKIQKEFRKLAHREGFYEVNRFTNQKGHLKLLDSSVGISPDGSFDIRFLDSSQIAYEQADVHVRLSRLVATTDADLPWRFVYGAASLSPDGGVVASQSSKHVLLVHDGLKNMTSNKWRVESICRVSPRGDCESNASIVANYSGPGDYWMALAMVQAQPCSSPTLSIWSCTKNWTCHSVVPVNDEFTIEEGTECLTGVIWLQCCGEELIAGIGQKILARANVALPLSLNYGLRILGSGVSMGEPKFAFMNELRN